MKHVSTINNNNNNKNFTDFVLHWTFVTYPSALEIKIEIFNC